MSGRLQVGLHVGQLLQPIPGGIGRYVATLCEHLPDAEIDVLAFASGPRPAELHPACAYRDLGWPRGALRYELWHHLRRPRLRLGPAARLVHAPSLAVPPSGRLPLVVTVHDLAFRRAPETLTPRGVRFHEQGFAIARSHAAVLLVASEFTAAELEAEGIGRDRIVVARHGITPVTTRAEDEVTAQLAAAGIAGPFLLSVGTVEPRKQFPVAAGALAQARREHPELQLVVAGPAGWGHVHGLDGPGVVRLGEVPGSLLDALYRRAVATLAPSRYEGFGLPALEAMARGCPVVVPPDGALAEVVGPAGAIRPATDTDFAEAVLAWMTDPAERSAAAERARDRAATFTVAASVRAHRAAYERALAP